MVWTEMSSQGLTKLFFVEPNFKIDAKYYQNKVLKHLIKKRDPSKVIFVSLFEVEVGIRSETTNHHKLPHPYPRWDIVTTKRDRVFSPHSRRQTDASSTLKTAMLIAYHFPP
ncbi:hypothetical protein TNCV_4333661 [Trichonephila clavipes]|nr:hypothetical protein TNCV_4333661 [Trichonephila clavipes]